MENQKNIISQKNIERLQDQGFTGFTVKELSDHQHGIRFAYWLCATFVILGLIFKSIPILSIALAAAFGAVIHSRHSFDYIYNYGVRQLFNKPETPKRTIQGKIACGIATATIIGIILFFYNNNMTGGYILGSMLLSSAFLVASTDICIPSIAYKLLMKNKTTALKER
jgi:hypothetical protein